MDRAQQSPRHSDERTADLFLAIEAQDEDRLKEALACGANPNANSGTDRSPLMMVLNTGTEAFMAFAIPELCAAGADVNAKSGMMHNTPLGDSLTWSLVVAGVDLTVRINALLEAGADLGAVSRCGYTVADLARTALKVGDPKRLGRLEVAMGLRKSAAVAAELRAGVEEILDNQATRKRGRL